MSAARGGLIAFCLFMGGAVAADDLGRLFFTPAERALLDAERSAAHEPTATAEPAVPTPAPAPAAPLAVNGLVVRGRGPSTVWIDGAMRTGTDLAADAGRGLRIAREAVEVDGGGTRTRVKPGQVYDPDAGHILEGFEYVPEHPVAPR